MNKKLITCFMASLLILTSCGINDSKKDIGTFEQELTLYKQSIQQNISKSINDAKEHQTGKFDIEQEFKIGADFKNSGTINGKVKGKWKTSNENNNLELAGKTDISLNVDINNLKDTDAGNKINQAINQLSGLKGNFNTSIEFIADKNGKSAFKINGINHDIKNVGMLLKNFGIQKNQLDSLADNFNKVLKGVWVDITNDDFQEVWKQVADANTNTLQSLNKISNLINKVLDINFLVPHEKTKYDGKEAYKFTVDDSKFKEYIIEVAKTAAKIAPNNNDISEEQTQKMRESLNSLNIVSSEGYLVKDGQDVVLIIKDAVLSKNGQNIARITANIGKKEFKMTFETLENKNDILKIKSEFDFENSEKTKFNIDFINIQGDKEVKNNAEGYFIQKMTETMIEQTLEGEIKLFEGTNEEIKINIGTFGKSKKLDDINIDFKSTIGNNKIITINQLFEQLQNAFIGSMTGTTGRGIIPTTPGIVEME